MLETYRCFWDCTYFPLGQRQFRTTEVVLFERTGFLPCLYWIASWNIHQTQKRTLFCLARVHPNGMCIYSWNSVQCAENWLGNASTALCSLNDLGGLSFSFSFLWQVRQWLGGPGTVPLIWIIVATINFATVLVMSTTWVMVILLSVLLAMESNWIRLGSSSILSFNIFTCSCQTPWLSYQEDKSYWTILWASVAHHCGVGGRKAQGQRACDRSRTPMQSRKSCLAHVCLSQETPILFVPSGSSKR